MNNVWGGRWRFPACDREARGALLSIYETGGGEGSIILDSSEIKSRAIELGADLVGIVEPEPLIEESEDLERWLRLGHNGMMAYMARNTDVRNDPTTLLPGCQSIIVIAVNYYTPQLHLSFPNFPKISRYAWGRDYHKVLGGILKNLAREMEEAAVEDGIDDFRWYIAVDTAPFRDKVWAQRAGLGWIGRNTMLLTREFGSWVFIGSLLTNIALETNDDGPHPNHCGTCTKCLEACPTGALFAPGKIDARKCLSYITIEHPGEIPRRYMDGLHGWIYGCDECQEVCPWNRFAKPSKNEDFKPREGLLIPDLHLLSQIGEEDYDRLTTGTALRYAGRERLRRNALAVMGLL